MAKKPKSKAISCPHCAGLQKEVDQLRRALTRQTKTTDGRQPKQLYFDEKWLAVRLGLALKTVQAWRGKGEGPKWTKLGSAVRYRLRDVVAFEKGLTSEDRKG